MQLIGVHRHHECAWEGHLRHRCGLNQDRYIGIVGGISDLHVQVDRGVHRLLDLQEFACHPLGLREDVEHSRGVDFGGHAPGGARQAFHRE